MACFAETIFCTVYHSGNNSETFHFAHLMLVIHVTNYLFAIAKKCWVDALPQPGCNSVSASNIEKAKALDPKNPRPIYLEGQAKFYTPEAFGGGKTVAKPILEKALAMFDTFKAETELHPGWGKASTQHFLAMANNNCRDD